MLLTNWFLGPDDAETFEMELSGFLREYGMLMSQFNILTLSGRVSK